MSKKIQGQIRVKGELTDYIAGRITGIIEGVICDTAHVSHATIMCNDDTFFRVDCTEKQFKKICKLIEVKYSHMYEIEYLKI